MILTEQTYSNTDQLAHVDNASSNKKRNNNNDIILVCSMHTLTSAATLELSILCFGPSTRITLCPELRMPG